MRLPTCFLTLLRLVVSVRIVQPTDQTVRLLVRNAVVVVVVHDRVVEVGEECVSGATAWCVDEGRCFLEHAKDWSFGSS